MQAGKVVTALSLKGINNRIVLFDNLAYVVTALSLKGINNNCGFYKALPEVVTALSLKGINNITFEIQNTLQCCNCP